MSIAKPLSCATISEKRITPGRVRIAAMRVRADHRGKDDVVGPGLHQLALCARQFGAGDDLDVRGELADGQGDEDAVGVGRDRGHERLCAQQAGVEQGALLGRLAQDAEEPLGARSRRISRLRAQ